MIRDTHLAALATAVAVCIVPHGALADQVVLEPVKDNTLFDSPATSGGAGSLLFSGRTGDMMPPPVTQRAVLEWDVAGSIPAGSTITSVSLRMLLTGSSPFGSPETHALHRLLAEWGEGSSIATGGSGAPATTGDATWLHTYFPNTYWTTSGGDFEPAASGSTTVGTQLDFYTWPSSPGMVADVQAWLDDDADNHGWMLRGNENDLFTSRRFGSREWGLAEQRPLLTIDFDPPTTCPDFDEDEEVGFQDLLTLLAAWSPGAGSCPGCPQDLDGDDDVDFQDLLILLAAWGPCA